MPVLRFTVEEAPGLLRALDSHDAGLAARARQALRDAHADPLPITYSRPDVKVHLLRADR